MRGIRSTCRKIKAGKPGRVWYDERRNRVVYKNKDADVPGEYVWVWIDVALSPAEIAHDVDCQVGRFWASWGRDY